MGRNYGGHSLTGFQIRIQALVNPTEDFEKVEIAIKKIFGEIKTKKIEEIDRTTITAIITSSHSLAHLKYILARDRIRDTTRRVLNRKYKENKLCFELNRQAAYAGHFSFYHSNESPLGPIKVKVSGNIHDFLSQLLE
jgi:predicted RNA binding protein with dsRBD fold (UPF0201 family)